MTDYPAHGALKDTKFITDNGNGMTFISSETLQSEFKQLQSRLAEAENFIDRLEKEFSRISCRTNYIEGDAADVAIAALAKIQQYKQKENK